MPSRIGDKLGSAQDCRKATMGFEGRRKVSAVGGGTHALHLVKSCRAEQSPFSRIQARKANEPAGAVGASCFCSGTAIAVYSFHPREDSRSSGGTDYSSRTRPPRDS
jgi:hypothetical protein